MATPLNLAPSYRRAQADAFTAACPLYQRAQDRRSRDTGAALSVSERRSGRLGMILCLMTAVAVCGLLWSTWNMLAH